jgi:hypothetical protein
MALYTQRIETGLVLGNTKKQFVLPDGTTLDFLFYLNAFSDRIGFNLTINSTFILNSINMCMAQNLIAPFDYLGRLYVVGDFPSIASIDKTALLYFEKNI